MSMTEDDHYEYGSRCFNLEKRLEEVVDVLLRLMAAGKSKEVYKVADDLIDELREIKRHI